MSKNVKDGNVSSIVTIPISEFIKKRIGFELVLKDFHMHPISTRLPYKKVMTVYQDFAACCKTTANASLTVNVPSAIWNRVGGII
jgi:hypothetical protein